MDNNTFEMIKKYAKELSAMESEAAKILTAIDGRIYETEDGADFADLKRSDIVISGGSGGENYAVERRILQDGGEVKAMVLSKTPFCTLAGKRGMKLVPALDDMAQIVGPQAETVPYEAKKIRKALKKATGCFVKDRYTISTGRSLFEAVVALQVLEKSAEVNIKAEVLGGPLPVARLEARLMRQIYKRKYSKSEAAVKSQEVRGMAAQGKKTPNPQADQAAPKQDWSQREQQVREKLVEFGKKVVETGLVQGTWGNLSMRLDDKYMIVTPSGLDYTRLTPADMVKVEIDSLEYEGDLKPTSEKGIHGGIYKNRPDASAIIHTHSKYCAVFAAARKNVPIVATEAEVAEAKATFGDVVRLAGYALPGTKKLWANTIAALGQNNGCIMANHGMLCAGATMEEAFENCRKLEDYCGQYIESRYNKGE